MRDNEPTEDGPDFQPGQIWLIEQRASGRLPALEIGALAGADVVLYESGLASIVADLLRSGGYAEPLPSEFEEDAPAIAARALKLASEGWSVVQLVEPCRSRRRRLRGAAEGSGWPCSTGNLAVRLIARTADPTKSREVPLPKLPELVDASPEGELLTLIVGPFAARASAAAYAFAANGLAG
jgi:hypothetical protein